MSPKSMTRARAATIALALAAAFTATSAAAAADTVTCASTAPVLAVDTAGTLFQYPLRNAATGSAAFGTRSAIGSGWQVYGRVLAGPSGWVYALRSDGLYVYHRTTAGTWDVQRRKFGFLGEFAAASRAQRIAADERGTIFVLDDAGALRSYRFNADHTGLVALKDLVLQADPSRAALVGAGDGVLFVRRTNGALDRVRYETTSDRILSERRSVGAGWNIFTKLTSPGGDVLLAVTSGGDLRQYRYREDTASWVVSGRRIGMGWQNMRQVTAGSNACRDTTSFVPATVTPRTAPTDRPGLTSVNTSPTVDVMIPESGSGLRWGRFDGESGGLGQVTADFPGAAGTPSVTRLTDGRASVLATGPGGTMHAALQRPSTFSLLPSTDEGGRMVTSPSSGSIGTTAYHFAVDAQGRLWVKRQLLDTGEFLPWLYTGIDGLAPVQVMVARAGGAQLVVGVVTGGGDLRLGRFEGSTLHGWTTEATGVGTTPSLVAYPGGLDGVLAYRGTDGVARIRTLPLTADGRSGPWRELPAGTVGAPSVAITKSGRVMVVSRGSSSAVMGALETDAFSGQWGSWTAAHGVDPQSPTDPAVSDLFRYAGDLESWVPVSGGTSQNGQSHVLWAPSSPYFG